MKKQPLSAELNRGASLHHQASVCEIASVAREHELRLKSRPAKPRRPNTKGLAYDGITWTQRW